jgi:excisionase family DNA binding protein
MSPDQLRDTFPKPEPLISPGETAALFNCHLATIRRLIADGSLKAVRLSKRRLGIRQSEIARYLEANELQLP